MIWNVLVLQAQGVGLVQWRTAGLVVFDHAAATTRIPAHRGQAQGKVARDQTRVHQRTDQGDGAGGVATGVGHALGLAHRRRLLSGHFRKTIDPAVLAAVGGRGVDDAGPMAGQAVNHGHRFARGLVVQAQHHQVGLGHEFALGLGVFAACRVDAQHLDLGHQGQPFADLQTGGAGFAVDENFGHK